MPLSFQCRRNSVIDPTMEELKHYENFNRYTDRLQARHKTMSSEGVWEKVVGEKVSWTGVEEKGGGESNEMKQVDQKSNGEEQGKSSCNRIPEDSIHSLA